MTVPPNLVVLSVIGYVAYLRETKKASSEPLFSWLNGSMNQTLRWHSSALKSNYKAFWATELAIYSNEKIIHFIPGAHIKAHKLSKSEANIKYIWKKIHDRYVFQSEDIIASQEDVRRFLEEEIGNKTIYYKGGFIERSITKLLNTSSVDIENRKEEEDFADQQESNLCKVHIHSLKYCPKAKITYLMNHANEWFKEIESDWDADVESMYLEE